MGTIDLSYLQEMTNGDNEVIVEMITLLLEETPKHLETIRKALNEEDWKQLASESHKVKPMMLYVGLTDLNEITKELETRGKSGEGLDKIPRLVSRLEEGFSDVKVELQEKVTELS